MIRIERKWCLLLCSILVTSVILYSPLPQQKAVPVPRSFDWMLSQRNISHFIRPDDDWVPLSPRDPCGTPGDDRSPYLLIMVCSAPTNFAARHAIRSSWGSAAHHDSRVKIFFLFGRTNGSTHTDDIIRAESVVHSDVIQYDFVDAYNNLTLKSVLMLKWINRTCPNAAFVVKMDDDTYLHIPNLIKELRTAPPSGFLMGRVISKAFPVKDPSSKWYSPDAVYSEPVYPDYLSGMAYVISGDVVPSLYKVALTTPFFFLEDIFMTGFCAGKLGIRPRNNDNILFEERTRDACRLKTIVAVHRISPQDMGIIWNGFQSSNTCLGFWDKFLGLSSG